MADHILSQENHVGAIGIGRKNSDSAFGSGFLSKLRKEFDITEEFIELYLDHSNPWLLYSRQTND
jgi:hypothetical protein